MRTKTALITGSGGLIGSTCARTLCRDGWRVIGVDNDMRQQFFGIGGSVAKTITELTNHIGYEHRTLDIRDRVQIQNLIKTERPDFIIHAAAQPSHDKASSIPHTDFEVNAVGTMNMLVAARDYAHDSPFCFCSTSKVYGDRPNRIPLKESALRFDYASLDGINEDFSVDQCLHSIFGASKLAADIMCQEFGRYYKMPVGIFRGTCLTGPNHAAVELHGYLAYICACAINKKKYTIFGHKGKQVRDQIHAADVIGLFREFYEHPRCGEVYNMGAGRLNSISILETVALLSRFGYSLQTEYRDEPRIGDHIVYISDIRKARRDFPNWKITHELTDIVREILHHYESRK